MKKSRQFDQLMKKLSRDPRLKRVIAKSRHWSDQKKSAKVEGLSDFLLLSLAIVSRFVSKKKARAIDEFMDVVYLLVQVSLLLKENVFDRPEVKAFLSRQSKRILSVAQEYVDLILSKTKGIKILNLQKNIR